MRSNTIQNFTQIKYAFFIAILLQASLPQVYAQNYVWAHAIGGAFGGGGKKIASDANGNVYVIGDFTDTHDFDPGAGVANLTSAGNTDIFIAKYDANGNYLWAQGFGAGLGDSGENIYVDASGNVYVTGSFQGTIDFDPGGGVTNLTSAGSGDTFFAKYDTNGNYIWAKSIAGSSNNLGSAISVDGNGNVYVVGGFEGTADFDPDAGVANLTSAGGSDIFFAKYNANGTYQWAHGIGGTSGDRAERVAIDDNGNTYIAGIFQGTVDFDPEAGTANLTNAGTSIFFAKYDTNGNYVWAKNIEAITAINIALDKNGNIYITGSFIAMADFDPGPGTANLIGTGFMDIYLAKYNNNGEYQWAHSFGTTGSNQGNDIAIDANDNIYITGYFNGTMDFDSGAGVANLTSTAGNDIFLVKYASDGTYQWAHSLEGTSSEQGRGIAVDGNGNVYITSFFNGTVDFDPGAGVANLTTGSYKGFIAKYTCAPTTQASSLVFGTPTPTTIPLTSFTPAPDGATGYVVKINDSNSFTTPADAASLPVADLNWNNGGEQVIYAGSSASPNLTVTGLTIGATYYFKVFAYNACDGTNRFETTGVVASQTTVLLTPVITGITTTEDEVTITWQDNNSLEKGYAIQRAPDAGGTPGAFQLVGTTPANQTSFTDVDLTSNTRYFYRVQAFSTISSGNSAFTAPMQAQTQVNLPVAPSHLNTLALSSTEVLVEWKDNASNESGYEIFRSPDGNVATFTLLTTTASNVESFIDQGLSSKTTYYYKVRATSVDGPSPFTEAVFVATLSNVPASPSDLLVSPVSASEMQLNWSDNSTNETAFIIKRTTDRFAGFTTLDTVTVNITTYLDSGLTDNTTYFYYVQAYNGAGLADKNSNIASGKTADVPLVPSNIQVTNSGVGSITISWDVNNAPSVIREADGFKIEAATILGVKPTTGGRYTHFANGRKVYRTNEDNDLIFFQVGTAKASERAFQMKNIIANLTYVFRVRAYNDKGNSPYTAESIIISTPDASIPVPSAPENLVAESISQTEIDLSWEDKSTDELFFRIERRKEGVATWTEVGLVIKGTTSFSSTGLEPDQKYYFRVRAGNQGGESAYTNVASTKSECNLIVLVTNVSGSNTICEGKTTLLKVNTNVTEATYQWKRNGINIPGANLPLYNASQLGKYECLVISGKCRSASANSAVVIVTSAFDVAISVSDSARNTLTANFKGAETYQWYRNYQPIIGATESSYQANTDGSYFVIATSQGCSVTSNLISWIPVVMGVSQSNLSKSIQLTPNPAQRQSWLEMQNDIMGPYKILVTDLQGRVQMSLKGVKHQKMLRKLLPVANLPQGMYLITVFLKNQQGIIKLLKE